MFDCDHLMALSVTQSGNKISRDVASVTVSAAQEEDVFLPCSVSDGTDSRSCRRVRVSFATADGRMKVILTRPQTSKTKDADRVKWEADASGQMSPLLTKLQPSDVGLYRCEIWKDWDRIIDRNISLKVNECKRNGSVKAAPSTTATLTCPVDSTPDQQKHHFSWEMMKGSNPASIISDRVEMNGSLLIVQSVSDSDSGWYRCRYTLQQTQRCFEINLRVQAEKDVVATTVPAIVSQALTTSVVTGKQRQEESGRTFVTVVVSVVAGVIVMASLTGLFLYRRRKTQRRTFQSHSVSAGTLQTLGDYEVVDLNSPSSEDPTIHRPNSLYQPCQDGDLYTFHY